MEKRIVKNYGGFGVCKLCGVTFKKRSNVQKFCHNHKDQTAPYRKLFQKEIKDKSYKHRAFRVSSKRLRRLKHLGSYKLKKGCQFCGYNKCSSALEFDHIERNKKEFTIGKKFGTVSLKVLFSEIRKCRVLCANCHAEITRKTVYNETRIKYNPLTHKYNTIYGNKVRNGELPSNARIVFTNGMSRDISMKSLQDKHKWAVENWVNI